MEKIRILQVTKSFSYAGTERVAQTFCLHLNKKQFEVFAIATHGEGHRRNILSGFGIKNYCARGNISDAINYAIENKIHVVHIHRSGGPDSWERSFLKGIKAAMPSVRIVETNVFGDFDSDVENIIDLHLLISKMILTEKFIPKYGMRNLSKLRVLPNPIDFDDFERNRLSEEEKNVYRKSLGITPSDIVLGKIGRPDITKWGDLILDMFPLILKRYPNVKFLIQSIPENRIKQVERIGYDRFILLPPTENQEELCKTYEAIDIYVHSSRIGESFGMTLAEAGIFKRPVVVNSTPHADNNQVELIEHGVSGYIANNPYTFADAVCKLIENGDLRKEFGENGYSLVKRNFEASKVVSSLEDLYKELFGRIPRGFRREKNMSLSLSFADIQMFQAHYNKKAHMDFRKSSFQEKLSCGTYWNIIHAYRRCKDYIYWKKSTAKN